MSGFWQKVRPYRVLIAAYVALAIATFVGLLQQDAFIHAGNYNAFRVYCYRMASFAGFPFWQRFPLRGVTKITVAAIFGPLSWIFLSVLAARITRALFSIRRAPPPSNDDVTLPMTRRGFLRFGVYTVPVLGMVTGAHAFGFTSSCIRVRRYDLAIKNLPPSLDGLRVVHLSDFHSGGYISIEYLRDAITLAMKENPDVAFVTGDFVSDGTTFGAVADLVRDELTPPLGVLCTLGNHDHWQGAQRARREFARAGVPLIDNQRRFLTRDGIFPEPRPGAICIAGIGDAWEDVMDFHAALGGVEDAMPRIMLSHNPDSAEYFVENPKSSPPRIDIMLCGHTHGGQVYIPGLGAPFVPSRYGQRYRGGLVQGPHWPVIISRGVGVISPPVRLFVPPEISMITLRIEKSA